MRKRMLGALVAGVLIMGAGPAPAGDAPVTISPDPVRQNEYLEVVAADCVSGDGWEAYVLIIIETQGGVEKYNTYKPADSSGTTTTEIKMKKKKYEKGAYYVYVECVHEFDDGGSGTWYSTEELIKVKKARRRG